MTKKVTTLLMFVCVLFCFSYRILAVNSFYDDFASSDLAKWNIDIGDTSWYVDQTTRELVSNVTYRQQGYLIAKNSYDYSDYSIDTDLENISGIDQHILFRVSPDKSKYYQLELRYPDSVWPQDPGNSIRIWKFMNGGYSRITPADIPFQLQKNTIYHVKIILKGTSIKVYINGENVVDTNDSSDNPILTGGFGFHSYCGDYNPGSVVNYYDNVIVSSDETPKPKPKIIFLPGFGASWNTEAMVSGKTGDNIVWKMTPFVHNYDRLIQGFKDNGLKENEDYYVFNYDWRRPISETVDNLNKFIDLKIKSGDKVDLVGHSMGGVVSRIWAQDHFGDTRLDQVVAMASPQMGTLEAYTAWNGVNLGGSVNYYDVALNVVSLLNKGKSVRVFSPALKDLFPIFDFIKINGQKKSFTNLTLVNNYLLSKNIGFTGLFSVVGVGETTKEWLNLSPRSAFDKTMGLWEDGSFKSSSYGDGDGSVLIKSGSIGSTETTKSNHGDIVDKSVNDVLTKLNLGTTVTGLFDNNLKNKLLFLIGSPAIISLSCDDQSYGQNDNDGFLLADAGSKKNCDLKLTGMENGTYHLVTGKIGEQESWHYFEDEIGVGQTNVIHINQDNGRPQCGNDNFFYGLIGRDLNILLQTNKGNKHLLEAIKAVSKKDSGKLINELFDFRKQTKEIIVTDRMIDNLRLLLPCKNKDDKFTKLKWAGFRMWFDWFKDNHRSDLFWLKNYQKIQEIYDVSNDDFEARLILMGKLAENVL